MVHAMSLVVVGIKYSGSFCIGHLIGIIVEIRNEFEVVERGVIGVISYFKSVKISPFDCWVVDTRSNSNDIMIKVNGGLDIDLCVI
jgi:hypothetical protein